MHRLEILYVRTNMRERQPQITRTRRWRRRTASGERQKGEEEGENDLLFSLSFYL
jgi:hypothetical protein